MTAARRDADAALRFARATLAQRVEVPGAVDRAVEAARRVHAAEAAAEAAEEAAERAEEAAGGP
ncbi:MAG: hypothetical protein M9894_12245 [Planctomycetes bacterium]|nr:hypothetical protein [Planctomycetota bacterium]